MPHTTKEIIKAVTQNNTAAFKEAVCGVLNDKLAEHIAIEKIKVGLNLFRSV